MDNDKKRISTKTKLIALEQDKFYSGKNGQGENLWDMMGDALENLNVLLANDLEKIGRKDVTEEVNKRINWYRTIERRSDSYTHTEEGPILKPNLDIKVNKILTSCMKVLSKFIDDFGYQ